MTEPVTPIWIRFWTVWAIALASILIVFIAVEALALSRAGFGDTLSESVWYLRNTGNKLYFLILDVVLANAITSIWLLFHFRWQGGQ